MIPDPDNSCCQKPFCSPLPLNLVPTPHPIAVPTSSSTIGPNPQDTLSPNPLVTDVPTPGPIAGPTIAPGKNTDYYSSNEFVGKCELYLYLACP